MARLLTIEQTAEYLGISQKLARKLMNSGEITCIHLHDEKNILYTTTELIEEFINHKIKEMKKANKILNEYK